MGWITYEILQDQCIWGVCYGTLEKYCFVCMRKYIKNIFTQVSWIFVFARQYLMLVKRLSKI